MEAIRAKWVIMFTLVFFLLAINIPFLILLAARELPPNYLDVYLDDLINLSFPYLPLLSLPLGAISIVDERESGTLEYILSNPISRAKFLLGRVGGLILATTTVIVLGYGIAALDTYRLAASRYQAVGLVVILAVGLNALMLGLGVIASILARRKTAAMTIAIFLWFLVTVLSDFGALGLVLSNTLGPDLVLPLVLLNPVESARILGLLMLHAGFTELGSTGLIVSYVWGSTALKILSVSLLAWICALFIAIFAIFTRQDIPS